MSRELGRRVPGWAISFCLGALAAALAIALWAYRG